MNLLSILLLSLVSLLEGGNTVNLTFVGDAMQHTPQLVAARTATGNYDYSPCFRYVEDDIRWADYAVVNLECPLGGAPYTGYPAFSAPDSYAAQLYKSGFDLFLTANNHCLDRRDKGLRRTISVLDSLGIPHVGTYVNANARHRQVPFITTIKGVRFAFLCYTYGTNGIPVQGDVVVDLIDRNVIARDLEAARAAGAQVLCACLHWGIEYQLQPVESQRSLADWLVEQGVDLIIGGHPHVVEPMEMRHSKTYDKDVLLVYSLGNFISNQRDIDCRGGAMVKVSVTMLGGKPRVHDARYKLFFVQKPTYRGENYVLIPENRPELVRADSRGEFTRFMQRTHSLVTSRNVGVSQEL
ncbi:MAG: CapA family protein [Muribaculaceae bacterium]|nr:CapA family protein [Muribaculaceae bacterium]